ncbi:hypothetical protein CEXT_780471 [Caerostris extrusa]|uniref:Uncharacterized protein n=1 Tax=Caerostris extrusa TaxID=172846 RepID=A0AAV4WQX7_CAEEX|nr:hypothetical protein CEXT_780471 [Caerostris extrusa]
MTLYLPSTNVVILENMRLYKRSFRKFRWMKQEYCDNYLLIKDVEISLCNGLLACFLPIDYELLELVLDSISRRATVAPPTPNPISESRGKSKKVFRNGS